MPKHEKCDQAWAEALNRQLIDSERTRARVSVRRVPWTIRLHFWWAGVTYRASRWLPWR